MSAGSPDTLNSDGFPFKEYPSASKQFQRERAALLRATAEEDFRERRNELLMRYLGHPRVKALPEYVGLWLGLAGEVTDPEEVFAYMHSEEIGQRSVAFYKAWIAHCLSQCEFILANQLLELAEGTVLGLRSVAPSAAEVEDAAELREWLERQILTRLVEDFYSKDFYQANVCWEQSGEKGAPPCDEGIAEEDFAELAAKSLPRHISRVLERVYALGDEFGAARRKSARAELRRPIRRKKFSDLINTKQFGGVTVYIEREFRNAIPKCKLLACEYEYMRKRYPNARPISPIFGSEQFFITTQNAKRRKLLKTRSNAPTDFPRSKSRVQMRATRSRNAARGLFAAKTLQTNSTALSLTSDFGADAFINERLFALFDERPTKVKLIKPRTVDRARGDLLCELPRGRER